MLPVPRSPLLVPFLFLCLSALAADYTPPSKADAQKALKEAAIETLASGTAVPAWMALFGPAEKLELVKADEDRIAIRSRGNVLDVKWERIENGQWEAIGKACAAANPKAGLALADYFIALRQTAKADEALAKALEQDPGLGREADRRWAHLKAGAASEKPAKGEAAGTGGDAASGASAAPKAVDRAAQLRELTDFSLQGMHRRLGPDYAFYNRKSDDAAFPDIYLAPEKEEQKRRYQLGGPYTKEAGDYSSTQGQVLYVPDNGFGVDRVTILRMDHHCFTEKPEPPWWGGFRPEPSVSEWQKAGGPIGAPIAVARGMSTWSNCGVFLFSSGFIGTAGTCTARGGHPSVLLPRTKLPIALSVTPRNEFALVTVYDSEKKQGQIAVIALEGCGKEIGFVHEWPEHHPCLANVAYLTNMKLLGYVDLPGMALPTGICGVGNHIPGRLSGRDGNAGLLREFNLANQGDRDNFGKGGNAQYTSSAGFAVVISKYENKAAFVDLQPLFQYVREMYFTTEENYRKTRDQGPAPNQWPYTFEHEPKWKPVVVSVQDVREPTAAIAGMAGGEKVRACIASQDGTVGVYRVGGLATEGPAKPGEIGRVGEFRIGRNPVCLNYQKGSLDSFLAVSRGDREVCWFTIAGDQGTVTRRLRDKRMIDPVFVEMADTHGISTNLITVCDFKGRKILNYRCSELVFATQGGQRFPVGKDGKDEFECGGVMEFPGSPFSVSASNVN